MLVQRARSVYWKKWAAEHGYELKEGAWLEPGPALLRQNVKENWTEMHRNVARKIFLEGGWTQKRLFDIGWSDASQCQACQKEEGKEKHRLYHCPERYEVRQKIPDVFRKQEQKTRTSKKEWKWQRGIVEHPLSGSQWNRGHFSMRKWESEKHKSWGLPAEGFKGHVATDGSLLGNAGKWGSMWVGQWCSWTPMERWGRCMGCVWFGGGRICGSAHHQEGGVDSFLVPPHESMWTHKGPCGQQGYN